MKNLNTAAFLMLSALALPVVAATADHKVHAELWDKGPAMGIKLDTEAVPAGKVTFDVSNDSKNLVHEMLVVQVKNYHDSVPYSAKQARMLEDKVKDYGEVSELEPGQSGSVTLQLKPGKYLLICNQPGHYEMGMYTHLDVTP